MDPRFRQYSETVAACLHNASPKERKAVRQELEDHLQDHAEALEAAGYPPEQAQAHALEAMGDPKQVGEELSAAFPLRWWVLSRVAGCVAVIALLLVLFWLPEPIADLYHYHQAKNDPLSFQWSQNMQPKLMPLDLKETLPGGGTLSIYAAGLVENSDGTYEAYVYAVSYSGGPFQFPNDASRHLTFAADEQSLSYYTPMSDTKSCRTFTLYRLRELSWGTIPTVCFTRNGNQFAAELPLPWQEVIP